MLYNSSMNNKTHTIAKGIQNGYELDDQDKDRLANLVYEGFKITRPNDNIVLGEKSSLEVIEKLAEFLSRAAKAEAKDSIAE